MLGVIFGLKKDFATVNMHYQHNERIYIRMCVCACVCVRVCVCVHACMHVCVHVAMYVCKYVYTYVCMLTICIAIPSGLTISTSSCSIKDIRFLHFFRLAGLAAVSVTYITQPHCQITNTQLLNIIVFIDFCAHWAMLSHQFKALHLTNNCYHKMKFYINLGLVDNYIYEKDHTHP